MLPLEPFPGWRAGITASRRNDPNVNARAEPAGGGGLRAGVGAWDARGHDPWPRGGCSNGGARPRSRCWGGGPILTPPRRTGMYNGVDKMRRWRAKRPRSRWACRHPRKTTGSVRVPYAHRRTSSGAVESRSEPPWHGSDGVRLFRSPRAERDRRARSVLPQLPGPTSRIELERHVGTGAPAADRSLGRNPSPDRSPTVPAVLGMSLPDSPAFYGGVCPPGETTLLAAGRCRLRSPPRGTVDRGVLRPSGAGPRAPEGSP